MEQQRHRPRCVRRMRTAGDGVAHHLAVAVVGRDQQRAAGSSNRIHDLPEAGIHRFDRLDRGRQDSRVAHHVRIGIVQHDQVVLAGVDRLHRLCRQLGRRHFRLQVIGCDLGRRHHDAVFAGKRFFPSAVEEIGDVRILLRFRHAQLRAVRGGRDFPQNVRKASAAERSSASAGPDRSLYCVMPTAAAKRTARLRGKPANDGSSIAPRISRTRSARKLKHSTPSPSLMPA